MRKMALVLMVLFPICHAFADGLYDKCMDEADGTNPGFGKCGGEWVARADATLNLVWKKLMLQFKDREEARETLLTEQRLWNAYKESSCNVYTTDFGREGQVIQFPTCRAAVIEQRTQELQNYGSD